MPGMGGGMNRGGGMMPGMGGPQGGGQAAQMMGAMYQPNLRRPTYGLGPEPQWTPLMWQMQSRCMGGDGKACQQLEAMKQGFQQKQNQYGQDYSFNQQNARGQVPGMGGFNGSMRAR